MKTTLLAAVAAVVLSSSAFAYTVKDSTQQHTAAVANLAPANVVNPTDLPLNFARQVVNIEFSVDAAGQPQDIKILSNVDRAAKQRILKAFKQWKFQSTATGNADAAKRYILPLEIVPTV